MKKGLVISAFVLLILPINGVNAHAVAKQPKLTYYAQRMIQSEQQVVLAPREVRTFVIAFKNTGSATWQSSGPAYVSAYTYNPSYRKSVFQDPSWKSFRQPAMMKNESAAPGELGFFEIKLRAPAEPGNYEESFALAAEDVAWIEKSHFRIPITVRSETVQVVSVPSVQSPAAPAPTVPNTADYQALRLSQSAPSLTLKPGEELLFHILFKNIGLKVWLDQAIKVRESGPLTIATAAPGALAFQHDSWANADMPVFVKSEILPGEVSLTRFTVRGPAAPGQYLAKFHFFANGQAASGGEFEIPITVTDDGGNVPPGGIPVIGAIPEPNIRIGLYTADDPVTVTATELLEVRTVENQLLGSVPVGASVTVSYAPGGGYMAILPSGTVTVSSPIRLVPTTSAVLTITNYVNHPRWSTRINDNAFRGALEIRRNAKGYTWVINELPLEQYLRGLAETGNGSPSEYHKAIIVAARTYAYWHYTNPSKHADSGFIIDAYWDQVYRGYNSEMRMQNFVASVEETRGAMVTFQNEIVVTPYFARSDGRTRTWRSVWGGADRPWIQSIPVPWDSGSRMLGHGVGMSATAASLMAKEGKSYPEILKYFYLGTDLKRVW